MVLFYDETNKQYFHALLFHIKIKPQKLTFRTIQFVMQIMYVPSNILLTYH